LLRHIGLVFLQELTFCTCTLCGLAKPAAARVARIPKAILLLIALIVLTCVSPAVALAAARRRPDRNSNPALCWLLRGAGFVFQREALGCPLADGLGASLAFRATQSLKVACCASFCHIHICSERPSLSFWV
jgi:hypothetical protein